MAKIVTGLDIGSESIKLVQVKRGRGDAISIVATASIDIPQGEVAESGSLTGLSPVAEALKKLLAHSKIHPVNLVTAVPKQGVVVRYITLPTTSVSEVEQMIRFEAAKYVPFFTDEDVVSFELLGSTPLGGSEILLVVSRRTSVEEHLNLLHSVHLEPYAAEVSSLALARAMRESFPLLARESDKTHLILDIGSSFSELCLIQNKSLRYTRTATIAGYQLVKALQDNLKITPAQARVLIPRLELESDNIGISEYPKEALDEAIGAWLSRLDNEIRRSIDYFSTEFGINQIHNIILSGGMARLPFLSKHLEREIGIPVNTASLIDKYKKNIPAGASYPEFNTAFGLALRKLDASGGSVANLLPPEILHKRVRRKQQKYALQLAGLVLLLMAGGAVFGYQKYNHMENEIKTIDKMLLQSKPKTDKLKDMKKQIDSIQKIMAQKDNGIETLSGVSQLGYIPSRVTLERYTYERNKTVTLYVVAITMDDAVNFRYAVEQLGMFKTVQIQNTNTDIMEGKPVIKFQLICKLIASKGLGENEDSSSAPPDET